MTSEHGLPLDRLEALFLDAGNTIVGMDLSLVAEVLAARGVRVAPDALARAEASARPAVSRHLASGGSSEARDTFTFYLRAALGRLSPALDVPLDRLAADVAAELKTAVSTRRLWSSVLPGVPEALAALRARGLRLVVVSNSDGSIERGIAEMGLAGYFDGVVDSTVVGAEKPDPRIFGHALDVSRTAPDRTAHVGDLYSVDVVGARSAGLHGVLLDPFGDWDGTDCPRFRDLAALARAITGP
ncbi:MAG TPA: HAD-IA family hydrolase [Candidatus Binatia bacterium]|nr:HAD-IA family hydrolase [Candidatus Binatia bacterium]